MRGTKGHAVERFYLKSHKRSLAAASLEAAEPMATKVGISAISNPTHRYHCVYRYLSTSSRQNIVELGFGDPMLIGAIASLSGHLTIVDIIDRTSGCTLPSNVSLEIADLNDPYPFRDGWFDAVVAMMVIEHLFDPFHAFRELARILKKDGHAFVNLPNIASIRCRLQLLAGRIPVTSSRDWFDKREWDGNHLHYFTVAEVERLAALFGLRLIRTYVVGKFQAIKRLRPTLFCHEISYVFRKQD